MTTDRTIEVGRSIRSGWEVFKANVFYLVAVFVIVSVVYGVIERMETLGERMPFPAEVMIRFGYVIAVALVEIGIINVALKMARGGEAKFEHLVSGMHVFVKYLIASLLYYMIILAGLLLLVIPGIYLAIKYGFYGYLIVDEDLDPLEAFKMSARMTEDIKVELFFYHILLFLINILGLLCLFVGVYVSWPVTRLALGHVYLDLKEQARESNNGPVVTVA